MRNLNECRIPDVVTMRYTIQHVREKKWLEARARTSVARQSSLSKGLDILGSVSDG